jgi:hypothetical protein
LENLAFEVVTTSFPEGLKSTIAEIFEQFLTESEEQYSALRLDIVGSKFQSLQA